MARPRTLRFSAPEALFAALRIALGITFVIGGIKIAFPPDAAALASSYTDPAGGWISPFFSDQLVLRLGVDVASFLRVQGMVEVAAGCLMIAGFLTPVVAILMALMFWSFTIANPIAGEIRLSRDIALAGLCIAAALAGGGRWSVDGRLRAGVLRFRARRDVILILVRLSLAYTLMASALFAGGVMDNHLNTTVPIALVLAFGLALASGIVPRWVSASVALWLLYVVLVNVAGNWMFPGFDAVKREIPLLVGAILYAVIGPDRWSWPLHDWLPAVTAGTDPRAVRLGR